MNRAKIGAVMYKSHALINFSDLTCTILIYYILVIISNLWR